MAVNTAFQSALSNDIVDEQLWFGEQFRIMGSNLLRIEDNLSSNSYVREVIQPVVFTSFKSSLELSFCRIMHAHKLQRFSRLLFSPKHAAPSLAILFTGYVTY
ncbi:hypothetical protein TNCV_934521 [Trichonephila clavipes]|nr:hypothetical protein TNCV_934521 [Trichonephila clavipes]